MSINLDSFPFSTRNNKNYMMKYIKHLPNHAIVSTTLQNDKDVVRAGVFADPRTLFYASEAIKDDKEFMLELVENNPQVAKYTSGRVRSDNDFMEALKKSLEHLPDQLHYMVNTNKSYVFDKYMREHQELLEFESDKDIVKSYFKIDPVSLFHATYELKNNREFILELIDLNCDALMYSDTLRFNKEFAEEVLQKYPILHMFPANIRANRNCVESALKCAPEQIKYVSIDLLLDKSTLLLALKEAIKFNMDLPIEIYHEHAFLNLLKYNVDLFDIVPNELKEDQHYFNTMLIWSPDLLISKVKPTINTACLVVSYYDYIYEHLPLELRRNKDVIDATILQEEYEE